MTHSASLPHQAVYLIRGIGGNQPVISAATLSSGCRLPGTAVPGSKKPRWPRRLCPEWKRSGAEGLQPVPFRWKIVVGATRGRRHDRLTPHTGNVLHLTPFRSERTRSEIAQISAGQILTICFRGRLLAGNRDRSRCTDRGRLFSAASFLTAAYASRKGPTAIRLLPWNRLEIILRISISLCPFDERRHQQVHAIWFRPCFRIVSSATL